jgi:hypothetical protein
MLAAQAKTTTIRRIPHPDTRTAVTPNVAGRCGRLRAMRALFLSVSLVAACKTRHEPQPRVPEGSGSASAQTPAQTPAHTPAEASAPARSTGKLDQLSRDDFNRFAVRQNLPIFWIADKNQDGAIEPDEVASLLFYPQPSVPLDEAYAKILAASKAPPASDPRLALVERDLDQGKPTLVLSEVYGAGKQDQQIIRHMLSIATAIDHIYETQNGALALAAQVPPDPESQSLFRRDRGPKCAGALTENDPQCSAIPGAPKPVLDIYPGAMQKSDSFCKDLEARPDAKELLGPFTVVREQAGKAAAVPYSEAYKADMTKIADELKQTAKVITDPLEAPLVAYLRAAANSFTTNDWLPADEAWAKMTVDNSRWYVRVGPDETYWETCQHKAGFHLTFAKIDEGSKRWQSKLTPMQQEMEAAVAAHAGLPYAARKVAFHLPDFIDIVINAGDDRTAIGATGGESLPNWGPVANEGRGRTVAMVNIYTDPDSRATRHHKADSVLDAPTMKIYTDSTETSLLVTILHEATHNLGPAHEYKVGGKTDEQIFGGPMAAVLEELKAQTGALFLIELVRGKGLISDELARQSYADAIVWALDHTSLGMYAGKSRKTYGNVSAIQLGFLIDHGALTWDANATAANGADRGAFTLHFDKMVGAADELMKTVAGIKARGDKAAAEALFARYVDSEAVVPHKLIASRFLRLPRGSMVYAIDPWFG